MPFPRPEETVRLAFEAGRAGDVRAVCSLLDDDVEQRVRDWFAAQSNDLRTEVFAHRIEQRDDGVYAYGRRRVLTSNAIADSPAAWRFVVRDGVITSITPVE